jgi:hypothetical protein
MIRKPKFTLNLNFDRSVVLKHNHVRQKNLKIPKEQSETANRRMADNTMA